MFRRYFILKMKLKIKNFKEYKEVYCYEKELVKGNKKIIFL